MNSKSIGVDRYFIIVPVLILILCIVLFKNTVQFEFLTFDDPIFVTENRYVKEGITIEGIKWAFDPKRSRYWHPLTWISHMLDCEIYGLNPGGHHLNNLILHTSNSILLFVFLILFTQNAILSSIVSILFVVHPLHVESIAWVSDRKDLLCGFFLLITLLFYLSYIKKRNPSSYMLVLTSYTFSVLSKLASSTLPILLIVIDLLKGRTYEDGSKKRTLFKLIIEKLPLIIISLLCISFTLLKRRPDAGGDLPYFYVLLNSFVIIFKYLQKIIVPSELSIPYILPDRYPIHLYIISFCSIILVTTLAIISWKKKPLLFFGWCWFIILILPVLGLIGGTTADMADRYTYIPMVGILIMLVWGGSYLFSKNRVFIRAGIVLVLGFALFLVIKSREQLKPWKDTMSLFTHTLNIYPDNYVAHASIGALLLKEGKLDTAEYHLKKSVMLNAEEPSFLNNYGFLLLKKGRVHESIKFFELALKKDPQSAVILKNLGLAHLRMGDINEAISNFEKALNIEPDRRSILIAIAQAQFLTKNYDKAIYFLRKAIRGDRYDKEILNLIEKARLYQKLEK